MKMSKPKKKQEDVYVRMNGSVHLNYIEAKHGSKDFVKIISQKIPKGWFATIMNNEDRRTSVSSIIICIYGETITSNNINWYHQWLNNLVNQLEAPVESAIFDFMFANQSSDEREHNVLVFTPSDGKVHSFKKGSNK